MILKKTIFILLFITIPHVLMANHLGIINVNTNENISAFLEYTIPFCLNDKKTIYNNRSIDLDLVSCIIRKVTITSLESNQQKSHSNFPSEPNRPMPIDVFIKVTKNATGKIEVSSITYDEFNRLRKLYPDM